ncbi:MAG: hypothetical protein KatS3mg110_2859 [Pirellulaceae bacterium]|nr:MAG: hypothetical protein KatS3mg110_2859 [Pirellulaceae bacterium]
MNRRVLFSAVLAVSGIAATALALEKPRVDYDRDIAPIFRLYCVSCHNDQDRESGLSLESYQSLLKGGRHGPALSPGQPESSRLWLMVSGKREPVMPPDGAEGPSETQQELLRLWIEQGAAGPQGAQPDWRKLPVPSLPAAPEGRQVLTALAVSPLGTHIALGRFGCVELRALDATKPLWSDKSLPGKVTRLRFSRDGQLLIAASGIAGLYGEAVVWEVTTGKRVANCVGHRDTLYDAALSPDNRWLATCSYDRTAVLWDLGSQEALRTFTGHNGPVYSLAFSPDGQVLATASADETVKLWQVATGTRLDTLSQPDGEQYAVVFDPQGRYLWAAGGDHRIRQWRFVSRERAEINPMIESRFGHEGTILFMDMDLSGNLLATAADDGTIKVWDAGTLVERSAWDSAGRSITALALAPDGSKLFVAYYDGTLQNYSVSSDPPPTTPEHLVLQSPAPAPSGDMAVLDETEPNDSITQAMAVDLPARIRGVIYRAGGSGQPDRDCFRIRARAGQQWVIEVRAARDKSPLDSHVEVLDSQGEKVLRTLLQAVRNSYFTFRGKDSNTSDDFRLYNWEEMELNEYLYANGEVVKLWLYPRGPDSGFKVYPGFGKRHTYFDTPALAHALGEPCYIVRPLAPHEPIVPNGLPVFPVYFENDDDSLRQLGADSRLYFTAPADGDYHVVIRDVRGFQGEDFRYELTIRPSQPDFEVTLQGSQPTVARGSGWEFTLLADRRDGFDGAIEVQIRNMPAGLHVTSPVIIEPGQWTAAGVIYANADAPEPSPEACKEIRLTARAKIGDRTVEKAVNGSFGTIKLGPRPKILVRIVPADEKVSGSLESYGGPYEFTLAPGQTITAKVVVERHGFDGRIPFGNEDSGRNLPHGVYVDNIGLNGLLIVEGSNERSFFITAAKWVPEQTRLFHLKARVEGEQTSWPAILHIRK